MDCVKFRKDFERKMSADVSIGNPAWRVYMWMPEDDPEASERIRRSSDEEIEAMYARCVLEGSE